MDCIGLLKNIGFTNEQTNNVENIEIKTNNIGGRYLYLSFFNRVDDNFKLNIKYFYELGFGLGLDLNQFMQESYSYIMKEFLKFNDFMKYINNSIKNLSDVLFFIGSEHIRVMFIKVFEYKESIKKMINSYSNLSKDVLCFVDVSNKIDVSINKTFDLMVKKDLSNDIIDNLMIKH